MALEDDLQQPGSPARSESGPQAPALEERVARLERELDALRRQVAVVAVAAPVPPLIPEMRVPAAPPPLPEEGWIPPPPPSPQLEPVKARDSFENRLGSEIFNRIGIVLLLIGTAWFLKYAVDRQWVGPTGRVMAGLLAGAGIVLWSERFRSKGFASFSYSLKALGSGVLYLSLWAAFHIYHLLPASAALGLMILVTGWNAWMAWAQNSELLAAYALAGGFASPMLLSTGGNHETFLFTYLLAIDIATVALVRLRAWPRLLLGAFPLTVGFFVGWYAEFFAASELALTAVFVVLFGGAFWSVPMGPDSWPGVDAAAAPTPRRSTLIEDLLLPLANAAFVALTFYSLLQDSGHHALLPWLMIALSAVYLGFMRLPQSRTASAIHLSLAVVFLTIAIPLKASGHWITVSWLVEGLALLWVSTRLAPPGEGTDPGTAQASRILRPLAAGSLLLGFCGICAHSISWASAYELPLLNKVTGTALIGIAVFAAAAWLSLKASARLDSESPALRWRTIAFTAFLLIDSTAVMLTLRELLSGEGRTAVHSPFQTADFVTALIGLAVFAGVVAASLRMVHAQPETRFWSNCAALSTIVFNLVAVLTGVREVDAIWDFPAANIAANPDAVLQQALAISGFLMIYGAALLAVGFWKRSAFLRWQALLLLVFTIFKAFVYDMRSLSQGYRVVSFLGLGALLMAISFAYQKDWLNLRGPAIADSSAASSEAAR